LKEKSEIDKKNRVNGKYGIVAVAINAKIGSQNAVKWAIKHLLTRGETIALIHVKVKPAAPISISTTSESYIYNLFTLLLYSYKCHVM